MISHLFLGLSMICLIIGAFGINRLEGNIPKLLTSSLIDTMALILLVVGLIIRTGFNAIGIRLIIVLIFVLLTTPVINHVITKAAYDAEEGKYHD